jgi:hypothetical protein
MGVMAIIIVLNWKEKWFNCQFKAGKSKNEWIDNRRGIIVDFFVGEIIARFIGPGNFMDVAAVGIVMVIGDGRRFHAPSDVHGNSILF